MNANQSLFQGKEPFVYRLLDHEKWGALGRLPTIWAVVPAVSLYFLLVMDTPEYPSIWIATALAGYAATVFPWVVWRRLNAVGSEVLDLFRVSKLYPVLPRWSWSAWRFFVATALGLGLLLAMNAFSGASTSIAQGLVLCGVAASIATAVPLLGLSILHFFRLATSRPTDLNLDKWDPLATPGIRALLSICRLEAALGALLFFLVLAPFTLSLRYGAGGNSRELEIWWSIALPTLAAVTVVGVFGPRWITSAPRALRINELSDLRKELVQFRAELKCKELSDAQFARLEGSITATKTTLDSMAESVSGGTSWVDIGSLVVASLPLLVQVVVVATARV